MGKSDDYKIRAFILTQLVLTQLVRDFFRIRAFAGADTLARVRTAITKWWFLRLTMRTKMSFRSNGRNLFSSLSLSVRRVDILTMLMPPEELALNRKQTLEE